MMKYLQKKAKYGLMELPTTMLSKIFTYICITFVAMMGFFGSMSLESGVITTGSVNAATFSNGEIGPDMSRGTTSSTTKDPAAAKTPDTSNKEQEMLNGIISAINIALSILTIIVTPAIILASWLMSPDWTSGDLFNMRPVIHDMWILISNVTYFIYAILLIVIALGTIFNSENYGYKQLLPRLALGIILVPLTWWFIQFTISMASIVTASVMNIPADIVITQNNADTTNTDSWWTKKSIPTDIVFENKKDKTKEEKKVDCTTEKCISPAEFLTPTGGGGIYGSLVVYAFAVFKVQDMNQIKNTSDLLTTPFQLVHQLIVGALMFILFGLLVMALVVLLFMRAVKLWFYAMFSPLMTLKFVLGDKIFGKDSESFDLKEFIGLAFVPAIVGLALSFGLVVVSMLMHTKNDGNRSCTGTTCTITLFGNTSSTITTTTTPTTSGEKETTTVVTLGSLKYTFKGAVTGTNNGPTLSGALDTSAGIVGTIIVDIIALIFIWIAFMAAKGVSKVASAAFEPFEQLGSKIAKLPKYAPIPFTGGMSMEGMKSITNEVINKHESESINRAKNSVLGKAMGIDKTASGESTVNTGKAIDAINANNTTDSLNYIKKAKESLQKDISEGKDVKPEIARLAESLRTLKKTNTIMYDKIVSDSGMDGKILKDIISDREKSITKNDFKIDELQKAILGSSTGGAGTGGNSSSNNVKRIDTSLNITLGNQTIKFDTQNSKLDISDEDRKELAKISKSDFIKLIEPETTKDQQDILMKALEKEKFADDSKK